MLLFNILIVAHIVTGTLGLASLWGPVITRKGNSLHKLWGRIFVYCMLSTGTFAVGMSLCSLSAPLETHPFSQDAPLVRGLFGWMMLYLGVLTIALAWHSFVTARNKRNHQANKTVVNYLLQGLMGLTGLYCAIRGVQLDQVIMVGVAIPGLAAAALNINFLHQRDPISDEWLVQHFRAGIGAGISVYTAFLAFGAVNWFPALAFNSLLWAIPTVFGVAYMIHHQWRVFKQRHHGGRDSETLSGQLLGPLLATLPQRKDQSS
ncbi:MAG: hypothetical protein CBC34_000435 [Hyphomicrobiaceae bacterium TMED74]|nr:hypothetical protein [Filomicrobium sp.]RPG48386.1 MAG: hypothetical protein CBC34_000435 [Hyphomicrobiaceae bacterium TMED74]